MTAPLSASDEEKLADTEPLSAPIIYEAVRRDGEEELGRPIPALLFSGLIAGVLISTSVLAQAILKTHTPADVVWQPLLVSVGYSLGFLLVILGRMQLFTENTITTVLPLMAKPTVRCFGKVMRLWLTVLAANVAGATLAAAAFHVGIVPSELGPALQSISMHAVGMGLTDSFLRGIPAGFIIAALVWVLAHGRTSEFAVITLFVWLIAAGDFTHVVAGSVEAAYVVIGGEASLPTVAIEFFVPTLLGNIVGGTFVFSLIAWAQVRSDASAIPGEK